MASSDRLTRRQVLRASALAGAAAVFARPTAADEPQEPPSWHVGIAVADITPPLEVGILMSTGRRLWRPFEGVRMPLEARALVVRKAERRVAVVALDLLGLGDEAVGGIRRFKEQVAGESAGAVEAGEILLCSTHTHSAPSSLGCTDLIHTEPFKRWLGYLAGQIGSAVKDAAADASPCRLMVGTESAPGHTVNRRIKTTAGIRPFRTTMPPETVIGPEGPTDESVNVAAFVDPSRRPVALVVNAACHPIHEMCIPRVSPDFPGEMVRRLDRRRPGCLAMFLNGAAGNLNPPLVSGGAGDARDHGRVLADAVDKSLDKLRYVQGAELSVASSIVELPARDSKGRPLDEPLSTRIHALRLGDAVFCFLPGEPFIETSLAIRQAWPGEFTVVVGYTDEWIGYIATDRAFDNGGYETNPGSWSKLRRGSEPILRREAIKLVGTLREAE